MVVVVLLLPLGSVLLSCDKGAGEREVEQIKSLFQIKRIRLCRKKEGKKCLGKKKDTLY